ncbi:ATP-dependent helicase HrpB [Sneathiella limimaris]|uniref:ATP-dependent helicase HrpB n=1 Tax=Sneathiella limimaris TaxID=1964213 RepID=UPI00146D2F6A|nr:ATP-dependent helicase HrpB [Sneathiella limimaris]
MDKSIKLTGLPVEDVLPELLSHLETGNVAVLQAPPGAGKTTLVPLWLMKLSGLEGRKILMLEPRRLAARAAARRMSDLLGEEVGETVGYRVRLDTKVSDKTCIEVVTEGILTRKLQQDPELVDTAVVIFDEFHERNLNSDLGLALTRQAQEFLREDLKIVVMSATLDAGGVAKLLGDAPVVTSEGQIYPVETRFIDRAPKGRYEAVLADWIELIIGEEPEGDILVFLPGSGEINRLNNLVKNKKAFADISVHSLYGNLPQKEQDQALRPRPDGKRKIILSTDIAETSLTIDGVRIVVDTGLSRKPRFDPNSGMSRLELKRISRASADQRRGRAGRMGPGVCYRMWAAAEDKGLIPHGEPEIATVDLCSLALELAKWGVEDASELTWMTAPPEGLLAQAKDLLISLGALDRKGQITALGEQMVKLPLHPRLAVMILQAETDTERALACDLSALLSERDIISKDRDAPNSDLKSRIELLHRAFKSGGSAPAMGAVLRNAKDLRRRFKCKGTYASDMPLGPIVARAYPDRIGEQRKSNPKAYRLSGGRGAALKPGDRLIGEPYLVVAELEGKGRDAEIRLAVSITYQQLTEQFADHLTDRINIRWEEERDRVIADEETCIGALVLDRKRVKSPDPEAVADVLLEVIAAKDLRPLPWTKDVEGLLGRARFLLEHFGDSLPEGADELEHLSKDWLKSNLAQWLKPYLAGCSSLADLQKLDLLQMLTSLLSWDLQQLLEKEAPARLRVPTGSNIRLDYSDPASPVLAVRLQELFGQADLPRLAGGKVPITVHLLSPAGRPAQITTDLAGFWSNSYEAVKKDLKGQYPKHYWPDDPMQAEPTARAKPRKS